MVNKPGFSLIELIVVIGLLSLLMLAISSTMLMSIVSSSRVRTTTKVKQSGNYALGQIQSMIRSAKKITTCDETGSTITIVNYDGGTTEFALDVATSQIASNSGTYLTSENLLASSFTLTCLPDSVEPRLIKVGFDLKNKLATDRPTSNPTLHFETSINLRNE